MTSGNLKYLRIGGTILALVNHVTLFGEEMGLGNTSFDQVMADSGNRFRVGAGGALFGICGLFFLAHLAYTTKNPATDVDLEAARDRQWAMVATLAAFALAGASALLLIRYP